MRTEWLVWITLAYLSLNLAQAGKFKLYHCQSGGGPVVVQDRPCTVTQMKSVKPTNQLKDHKKQPVRNKSKHSPKSLAQASLSSIQGVSPQAFIDIAKAKNRPSKLSRNKHGWRLIINLPGLDVSEQAGQLSVHYYQNPQATLNQDAFSYALNLYHEIRHQHQIIDSRFKFHSAYKVFNIAYQKAMKSANTEFYMGKTDGSLWVFSLESRADNLPMARHLMAQLQALI